ncbi:MAG: hypothetical protein JWL61_2578, partial [Gemmatimonadetes bacterium]|nr:hypothetical protein [Gemmatimonadota bacterium]
AHLGVARAVANRQSWESLLSSGVGFQELSIGLTVNIVP